MSVTELVAEATEGIRPLRRVEYDRLVADGVFADERIELLQGMLVQMSPQDPVHADAIRWLDAAIAPQLAGTLLLQAQLPFAASDASEPEPDLAVVPAGRYRDVHPSEARLIIEVARTSQRMDLGTKAVIYAGSAVDEYWVVDVAAQEVVVHRRAGPSAGWEITRCAAGSLAAEVGVTIDVDDLFRG